jgi:hypothetical protein
MSQLLTLFNQLPGQYELVDQLLFNDQSVVKEGDERASVFQLFRNDRKLTTIR